MPLASNSGRSDCSRNRRSGSATAGTAWRPARGARSRPVARALLSIGLVSLGFATGLSVAAPSIAWAVSPAAEALFQEGRRLLSEGQTDEACARFAGSFAIEASSGTLLNLASCHEKQDKTATAWAEYRAAARLARG